MCTTWRRWRGVDTNDAPAAVVALPSPQLLSNMWLPHHLPRNPHAMLACRTGRRHTMAGTCPRPRESADSKGQTSKREPAAAVDQAGVCHVWHVWCVWRVACVACVACVVCVARTVECKVMRMGGGAR